MGINRRKRKGLAGSFTVELACLMPLIFLIVFGVWSLSFYMHHKAWLTEAAYEAALIGTGEGLYDKEQAVPAARLRAGERLRDFFCEEAKEQIQVQERGKELWVTYRGETASAYGGMVWKFRAQGHSRLLRPVERLRMFRMAKSIKEKAGTQ